MYLSTRDNDLCYFLYNKQKSYKSIFIHCSVMSNQSQKNEQLMAETSYQLGWKRIKREGGGLPFLESVPKKQTTSEVPLITDQSKYDYKYTILHDPLQLYFIFNMV